MAASSSAAMDGIQFVAGIRATPPGGFLPFRLSSFPAVVIRSDSIRLPFDVLPSFTENYLMLPSFTEFYLVLPSFTEFYLVLPSFTEFYLVSPSFTEFYRVLPSFTVLPSVTGF